MTTGPDAVYQLHIDDGYATLRPADGRRDPYRPAGGVSRAADWTPGVVVVDDDGGVLPLGDAPALIGLPPVFAQTAVDAVGDLLAADGELLPLTGGPLPLYFYNCTRIVDALDMEASEISRYADGRLSHIERHVLRPQDFDAQLALLAQTRFGRVYATAAFMDAWHAAGLRGLAPDLVWRAEGPTP